MTDPEGHFVLCDQRRALLDGTGHALVLGGPGSGKTTIALLKAHRVALEGLPDVQSVLFLSFSNAAVRRIAERAASLLVGTVAKRIEIKTFHSFAWEVLKAHGYLLSSQRVLKIIAAQDAAVRSAGLSEEEWNVEQDRLFNEEGLVTYDQFAPRAAELLGRCPRLRDLYTNAFPIILVDEFQDTDAAQWAMVKALSVGSDVIALGDAEQSIYQWRPSVSPERLEELRKELKPQVYDFGNENNRSPKTGIASYARALLDPSARLPECDEVKVVRFKPSQFGLWIKLATKHAMAQARRRTSTRAVSVAVAGRSKTLVRLISDALSQEHTAKGVRHGPIGHDLLIEQSQVLLAARVTAFLLEASTHDSLDALAISLELIADMHRSGGKLSHVNKAKRIMGWARNVRAGQTKATKLVVALSELLGKLRTRRFSGVPTDDWVSIRRLLEQSDVDDISKVGEAVRFLRLLRRGSAIDEVLVELWRKQQNYRGASQAVEDALLRDQLLDGVRPPAVCTVMTMHQLKSREYDAVVIVEDQYRRFLSRDERSPYKSTRRLLNVAVTRARVYAIFVIPLKLATFDVMRLC